MIYCLIHRAKNHTLILQTQVVIRQYVYHDIYAHNIPFEALIIIS